MVSVSIPPAFSELADYLAQKATPQEILDFQVSETAQARADDLLERNSNQQLTHDE